MDGHFSDRDHDDRPLILLVDDDPETITLLGHLLRSTGYRTISADNGSMGIDLAEKYRPNAIILDLDMPGMDGYAVCEALKSRPATAEIPILFGTGAERTDEVLARCFDLGANDFVSKPFNRVDLLARLRVALREQAMREAYRRLATEDPSTGLGNRRQFIQQVGDALAAVDAESTETVLIFADIDDLAAVNSSFGYELGDELILTFAHLVRRLDSANCKTGKIGGDEFGLLLTNASRTRGLALSDRLRRTFASIVFDAASDPKHFTACFGLAACNGPPVDLDADAFLRQADTALCAAKQAGQSRVVAYWQLGADALATVPRHKRRTRTRARRPAHRTAAGDASTDASGARLLSSPDAAPANDAQA